MSKINARRIHPVTNVQDYAKHLEEFGMYSDVEGIKKQEELVDALIDRLADARDTLNEMRRGLYTNITMNWTDKEIDKARTALAKEINEAE